MSNKIELPVSAQAAQHIQRLFEAAQDGKLKCIERGDGSRFYYVKQDVNETILHKLLRGEPGPKPSAAVLKLVVTQDSRAAAHQHVQDTVPALLSGAASARTGRTRGSEADFQT